MTSLCVLPKIIYHWLIEGAAYMKKRPKLQLGKSAYQWHGSGAALLLQKSPLMLKK
jgi:hypothetical protein